jgi:hypothetical protein
MSKARKKDEQDLERYRMKAILRVDLLLASAILIVMSVSPPVARADSAFNYVSSPGSEVVSSDCSSTSTASGCSTWIDAIGNLTDRGSVSCINAITPYDGNDKISIDRSLLLDCSAGGGGADTGHIIINAPGKHVRVRNISIHLSGTPSAPCVDIVAAASVEFEKVVISGSGGVAIRDRRAGPGKLSIRNSVVVDNTGPGIAIVPQSGTITALLENVSVRDSSYGLAVGNGGRVMVTGSVFSQNTVAGIEADAGGIIEVSYTLVSNNPTGIVANAGSTISTSSSGINSNNVGISGTTRSYGNNRFFANAVSDGTPPTPAGSTSSENGLR